MTPGVAGQTQAPGRRVKRAIDIAGALGGIAVLSPVMACVGVAVRWRLGSPVLFRQTRPGLHGAPFVLLKFRTMSEGTGNDEERMTRLGSLLRSTSLDELPELWNVLRGEMSLVGPRPLLMEYLELYDAEQYRRHDMRPGLTGLAQVSGRNETTWERRFAADIDYVDNWSLALDFRILAKTVVQVISRDGVDATGMTVGIERFGG